MPQRVGAVRLFVELDPAQANILESLILATGLKKRSVVEAVFALAAGQDHRDAKPVQKALRELRKAARTAKA